MFDSRVRRHPVQTFQFWFVVLTCFVGATAWKLDLFRISGSSAPIVVMTEEPMPPPPASHEELESLLAESTTGNSSEVDALKPNDSAQSTAGAEPEMLLTGEIEAAPLQTESQEASVPEMKTDSQIIQTAALQREQIGSSGVVTADLQMPMTDPPAEAKAVQPRLSSISAEQMLLAIEEADRLIQAGEDIKAHRLLSETYWKARGSRQQLMSRLNLLAHRIYFSSDVHYLPPYEVHFGDRLEKLAARYRVSSEYLARLNRLDSPALKVGRPLKVIQGPFSAVIDPAEFVMTIHSQGYFVTAIPIGFGTEQPISGGTFRVTKAPAQPNESVSLAKGWMEIQDPTGALQGFRIQGTSNSNLIGTVSGPGGIRMGEREFALVYDLLTEDSEFIINPPRRTE
jgi:FOG: LysM repeat